ncbi:hypothetical protein LRH25_24855 [Ideonella azotifigens]|uniref:Uncharacterized protein n=1 Tax=Ideonella azotifigens TaxID=513160 RepID=A0ABN1JHZ5_9BURK|nr:hypothetical protein [Ideonella azotifigens]MCD2343562.1 hypothetical protein [Ideonella azotifigens]
MKPDLPLESIAQRRVFSTSADVDGRSHVGFYAVQADMLTAWIPQRGSRTARLGQHFAPAVARELIVEIVRECPQRLDDGVLAEPLSLAQGPATVAGSLSWRS